MAVSFQATWGDPTFVAQWSAVERVASDRLKTAADPLGQRGTVLYAEVRPGDDPLNTGGHSERCEVSHPLAASVEIVEDGSSSTQYHAVSVWLDTSWQTPDLSGGFSWAIFWQLHGGNTNPISPSLALDASDAFYIETCGGEHTSPVQTKTSLGPLVLGGWVDFLIGVTYAPDGRGGVAVWRRNPTEALFRKVAEVHTPILQTQSGVVDTHYWKTGLYRSASSFTHKLLISRWVRASTALEAAGPGLPEAYAVENASKLVTNRILWDGATAYTPGSGLSTVRSDTLKIGDTGP